MMYDKNGLLPTAHVSVRLGRFYLGDEELFVSPECRGVVDYLFQNESLWSVARLRFNHSDIRQKRAPIIGVPFGQALRQAYQSASGLQKSMFQVAEWTKYQGKAVIDDACAHVGDTHPCGIRGVAVSGRLRRDILHTCDHWQGNNVCGAS